MGGWILAAGPVALRPKAADSRRRVLILALLLGSIPDGGAGQLSELGFVVMREVTQVDQPET